MPKDDDGIYIIPPNFIDSGTLLGGMIKIRNAAEAGVVALAAGIPVFSLPLSITAKIITLCFTALPLAILAVIGISGESLSSFALNFLKYWRNKRVIGRGPEKPTPRAKEKKQEPPARQEKKARKPTRQQETVPILAEEFGDLDQKEEKPKARKEKRERQEPKPKRLPKKPLPRVKAKSDVEPACYHNPVAAYLPIEKIQNGVVYTKDHRYIKILELNPVNFLLRNESEKRNIIYSYASFLKISPVKLQIKVLSKRADVNRHLEVVRADMEREENEQCRLLQQDMANFLVHIGSREGVSRRFFLIFEYEPLLANRRGSDEADAIMQLQTAVQTVKNYLRHCGNEVIVQDNEDEFAASVFYSILNRRTSTTLPFADHATAVIDQYLAASEAPKEEMLDRLPVTELFAPDTIDCTHGRYVEMDGVYHAYLLVPSNGYKTKVFAGWLSTLVNAGEGIDLDLFLERQPKDRIMQKLGRQLRINRSKIKETSDTNSDFDDLEDAIRSGYYLKDGVANNQDFYYMDVLITVTADNPEDLEWRVNELEKLLVSQDMDVRLCLFRQEQAMVSALPLIFLDKALFDRSKRNVLTSGVAGSYPFTSYEVCNDDGVLLGVNRFNSSLVIVDLFNSQIYKNANMVLMGTSGAGKTFTLQLVGLRLREKGTQVFTIVPLKGHEYHRACTKVGGTFAQISPASPNCINIMEIRRVDRSATILLDGETVQRSDLAAKIQSLHVFFSLLIPDMSYEERQLLDNALVRTYESKGITHDNASLEDPLRPGYYREMPILGDLYTILEQLPETKRMANIVNRLVNGSARSFNQQTNVDLNNKYVVLDISELTGDLLPVGMYVALDYVWDKAKEDRTVKKAIILDEIWKLIGSSSNRMAAEHVLEIFKIIRGYGGSAICATQDIDDYFALDDGKYGKGIINNAKTKIVLNLEEEEARRIQPILHLSDSEVMEITHFERGNALISTNNNNLTVEFRASELEKSLITTDRKELQALVEAAQQAS